MEQFAPGTVLAGKYSVERVLGTGGMGIVLAARHLDLEERVAVKVLRHELAHDSVFVERFMREARNAVKIKSEHIARVMDVGRLENGVPYLVMEFLDGRDLAVISKQRNTLGVEESVDLLLQACEAVAAAHVLGIVHRDLKPANLFVSPSVDGSLVVKVLDFGISKLVVESTEQELSLTTTANVVGSPAYMSPEQMTASRSVDTRTDVWALGMILYRLIGGRTPFSGTNVFEITASVLNETPPRLRELRPDVPAALDDAVMATLQKNRDHRTKTVAAFARAIAPFGSAAGRAKLARIERIAAPHTTHAPDHETTMELGAGDISVEGSAVSIQSAAIARTSVPVTASTRPRRPRGVMIAGAALLFVSVATLAFMLSRSDPRGPAAASQQAKAVETASAPKPAGTKPAEPVVEELDTPEAKATAAAKASAAPTVASAVPPKPAAAPTPISTTGKTATGKTAAPKSKPKAGDPWGWDR